MDECNIFKEIEWRMFKKLYFTQEQKALYRIPSINVNLEENVLFNNYLLKDRIETGKNEEISTKEKILNNFQVNSDLSKSLAENYLRSVL